MASASHVAIQNDNLALLNLFGAGDQCHQCRLTDAVRADDADHAPARNTEGDAIKRQGTAVMVGDLFGGHNGRATHGRRRRLVRRDV
jgi:hypothetical protein